MKHKFKIFTILFALITTVVFAVDKFDSITTNSPSKLKVDFLKGINFTSTDSLKVPVGSTAQRDVTPANGMFRLNSTNNLPEMYFSSAWRSLLTFNTNLSVPVELDMNSNKIVNLTNPTNAQEAATKNYVDTAIGAIDTSGFVATSGDQTIGGTKTFSNTIVGSINGNAATVTTNANLTGEVTSSGNATTISNSAVIGKTITGFVSGAGALSGTDTILQAIQKLDGNIASAGGNLTGPISATGGVTSVTSQTGTGSKFVMDTSPTLITPTFSGTATGNISGNAATVTTNANLTGEVVSTGNTTTVTNAAVIAKTLTGYTAGAGSVSSSDSILGAIQKVDGNVALKQNLGTLTTKGDIYVATASATTARQAVGADGTRIVADSGTTNGIRYDYDYDKNYIANDGAETDITGWSTFADAASSIPVDLTGGSPTSTFTRTTSTNLNGSGSFTFSKDAANRQGEGFSYAFAIDNADTTKVLRIDFNYQISSGTYADDDMSCWVYDTTGSSLIQPAPYKIKNSGVKESFSMEFQSTTSTSYRFGCFVASTSTSAYDLKFDKFKISKSVKAYGRGDTEYSAQVSVTGVVSAPTRTGWISNCTVSPAGQYTCPITGFTVKPNCNPANVNGSSASTLSAHWIESSSSASSLVFQTTSNGTLSSQAFGISCQKSGTDYANASGLVMSNDADTRLVSFVGYVASNQALTAGTTNLPLTPNSDTHAAWGGSSYTVKVPGSYLVTGSAYVAGGGATADLTVYVNGSINSYLNTVSSTLVGSGVAVIPNLKAGDTVSIRAGATTTINASTASVFSITKFSGPAQIAASESVSALYTGAPPTGTLDAAVNIVTYGTKIKDSHNAYSGGAYTVPVPGTYSISTAFSYSGSVTLNQNSAIYVYINGVEKYYYLRRSGGATSLDHVSMNIQSVPLLAGDVVTIRTSTDATTPTYRSVAGENYFSITRTGNY